MGAGVRGLSPPLGAPNLDGSHSSDERRRGAHGRAPGADTIGSVIPRLIVSVPRRLRALARVLAHPASAPERREADPGRNREDRLPDQRRRRDGDAGVPDRPEPPMHAGREMPERYADPMHEPIPSVEMTPEGAHRRASLARSAAGQIYARIDCVTFQFFN